MPQSDPQLPDDNSKSKRKADMLALQKIGKTLMDLTPAQLAKIPLPENLLEAIQHANSLTSNEAKRRQLQYIGKIMRDVDPEPIKKSLLGIQRAHAKNTQQFHLTEEWRAKLVAAGDTAINSFLVEYPETDRQQLRQFIRKAQHDQKSEKNTGAEKALFQYLRAIIKK